MAELQGALGATVKVVVSTGERRKFLRHVRPFWEIHRHRMALAVADRFHTLLTKGEVRVVAGRVFGRSPSADRNSSQYRRYCIEIELMRATK